MSWKYRSLGKIIFWGNQIVNIINKTNPFISFKQIIIFSCMSCLGFSRILYVENNEVCPWCISNHKVCSAKNAQPQSKSTLLCSCADSLQYMCGYDIEDSCHYLLECIIYVIPRQQMLLAVSNVIYMGKVDVSILLYGSRNYEVNTCKIIFRDLMIIYIWKWYIIGHSALESVNPTFCIMLHFLLLLLG